MIMPKKELKSENSAGTALQEMESLSPGGDLLLISTLFTALVF